MTAESALLRRLRFRLIAWYVITLAAMLLLLGGGLYVAISRQIGNDLTLSLHAAAGQVERAARIREVEAGAPGRVVDAVEELHIPDRMLYLTDASGASETASAPPAWVRNAMRLAGVKGEVDARQRVGDDAFQAHAIRFTLASGRTLVAAAAADTIELEDRYAALIALFGSAALAALLLVAGGGWILVRTSTAPVERSIAQMRRFMADAAHELRTPITVLRAHAEVALQRERDPREYVSVLHQIAAEGRRLGRIVDDLLTLARADAQEPTRDFQPAYLDDIVMDAAGAAAAIAASRGITLSLARCEEAPVLGDAGLLRQLVMILLDNAIKFSPPASVVTVTVAVEHGEAVVVVSDRGPGISAEQLPHIFERFYRGDPARSREQGEPGTASGSGLGLSIAQWVATQHRGQVVVTSAPGGTTATVRLPAIPAAV